MSKKQETLTPEQKAQNLKFWLWCSVLFIFLLLSVTYYYFCTPEGRARYAREQKKHHYDNAMRNACDLDRFLDQVSSLSTASGISRLNGKGLTKKEAYNVYFDMKSASYYYPGTKGNEEFMLEAQEIILNHYGFEYFDCAEH